MRGPASLVRNERKVKGPAVVRDDSVGVVEPAADLGHEFRVVAEVVARAEEVEYLLGVGCGRGGRGVGGGNDGDVVLVGAETCRRGRACVLKRR